MSNNLTTAPASAEQHLLSPAARKSVSTMLNGTLRVTVKTMLRQGLSVEDVAIALEIPQELVQAESDKLEASKTDPGPVENSISAGVESSGPNPANVKVAEDGLARMQPRALEVIEELLDYADSSTVRMSAARMILEGANGSLRPKQIQTGNNFTAIQILFQNAQEIYNEQRRLAGEPVRGDRSVDGDVCIGVDLANDKDRTVRAVVSAPVDVEVLTHAPEPKA